MKKLFTFLCIAFALSASAQILSVSPNIGQRGQTLNVTITGSGTHFTSANIYSIYFHQGSSTLTINSVSPTSNTILVVNITINQSKPLGLYDLTIDDQTLSLITLTSAFQVNLPTLNSVTPNNAQRGQTLNVTITGTNTHFTQGSNLAVSFLQGSSTLLVNSVIATTNTSLTANITVSSGKNLGAYNLNVYDPISGTISLASAFQVNAGPIPSLTKATPARIFGTQPLNVTITGTNTHFTQGSNSVNFFYQGSPTSTIIVNTKTVLNDTTLICNVVFLAPVNGNYDIRLYNAVDGILNLTGSFAIATGINEQQSILSSINIYPNPANDVLNISFAQQSSSVNISIFDLTGRLTKTVNTDNNNTSMDVSDLNNGIYFVTISGKDFTTTRKIIINK